MARRAFRSHWQGPAMALPPAVEKAALKVLGLSTLDARGSDSLDFSDQAVWNLQAALVLAYQAGLEAGRNGD